MQDITDELLEDDRQMRRNKEEENKESLSDRLSKEEEAREAGRAKRGEHAGTVSDNEDKDLDKDQTLSMDADKTETEKYTFEEDDAHLNFVESKLRSAFKQVLYNPDDPSAKEEYEILKNENPGVDFAKIEQEFMQNLVNSTDPDVTHNLGSKAYQARQRVIAQMNKDQLRYYGKFEE